MKETKDSSQRLTKAEKSWILYDVATRKITGLPSFSV